MKNENDKKSRTTAARTPQQEAFCYNVLAIDCLGRGNPSLAADMCKLALNALRQIPGVL